jgi:hypothetical protein
LDFLADGMREAELLADIHSWPTPTSWLPSLTPQKWHASASSPFRPVGLREIQA